MRGIEHPRAAADRSRGRARARRRRLLLRLQPPRRPHVRRGAAGVRPDPAAPQQHAHPWPATRRRESPTRGCPAAWPVWSACSSSVCSPVGSSPCSGAVSPPATRSRRGGPPARGRTSDGRGTRSPPALPRALPRPPAARAPQAAGAGGFRRHRGAHPARAVLGRMPSTVLLAAVAQRCPGCRSATSPSAWSSRCPSSSSPLLMPFVASGPRVAVGPLQLSERGLLGAWAPAGQGHARRHGLPRPGDDHRAPRTWSPGWSGCGCPTSSCRSWASWCATSRWSPASWQRMKDRPGVPWLRGPLRPRVAGPRVDGGGSVHPLLRARRAGPPGHALARLHRPSAGDPPRDGDPGAVAPGRHTPGRCPGHPALAVTL